MGVGEPWDARAVVVVGDSTDGWQWNWAGRRGNEVGPGGPFIW